MTPRGVGDIRRLPKSFDNHRPFLISLLVRIAAPMVGGMITAPLLSMFVVPVVYLLLRRRQVRKANVASPPALAGRVRVSEVQS